MKRKIYLLESNIVGVLSEALAAQVQTVLADQTVVVGARPAAGTERIKTNYINTCRAQYKYKSCIFGPKFMRFLAKSNFAWWAAFGCPWNLPAAGALAVFAGMREPNISETHVARLSVRHEKKSKMAPIEWSVVARWWRCMALEWSCREVIHWLNTILECPVKLYLVYVKICVNKKFLKMVLLIIMLY